MAYYAVAFFAALLCSLVFTWVVQRFAIASGFVDQPDGSRKTHQKPVALGGGAAVFLAALVAIIAGFVVTIWTGVLAIQSRDVAILTGLSVAACLIVALGLIDDIVGMRGRYKLLGQIVVVGVLIYAGMRIERFTIFGQLVELHWFAIPFTVFWLLGAINAINLIDGVDGLASSVGLVLALTIAAITFAQSNVAETIIMLALAGALLGFLRFNFAPASIFLGDAGSMLIGLVIGAIAIHSSIKAAATLALTVPVAVWSIPILDSGAAILRRKLTGRSLFAADRGHLHHSLLVRGWSVRQTVLFIGLICATTCLSAVLSFYFGNEFIALITVGAVAAFLVMSKTFGHIEFALLKDRVRFTARSLSHWDSGGDSGIHESRFHMQGARPWDILWTAMVESAEDYRLVRLKLTIDIPALQEAYFATWSAGREGRGAADRMWKVVHPLIVGDQNVGQLEVAGVPTTGSTLGHMIQVFDFLEPIEEDVRQIMEEIQHGQATLRVGQTASSSLRKKRSEEQAAEKPLTPPTTLTGKQFMPKG